MIELSLWVSAVYIFANNDPLEVALCIGKCLIGVAVSVQLERTCLEGVAVYMGKCLLEVNALIMHMDVSVCMFKLSL